jgi:hypothetical protein
MRIKNKAESPDRKVMGLFYFGNSPMEHTITDVFEKGMSNPGTVKTIWKLNRKKVILTFAFITDNLY